MRKQRRNLLAMSDLEKIGDNQMDLRELAQHQPKRVDDNQRQFRGMLLDEWYEIVQWLQLRVDDASKWSMTKIDVMYSDLKDYTKGDVFYAIQLLYQEGRSKAPDGGRILAKLNALDIPKVRNTVGTVTKLPTNYKHKAKCNEPGYACMFLDQAWFTDDYGNWHFEQMCTANGDLGICEARQPAIPNDFELRTKPQKMTKGILYRQMCKMNTMNDNMKKQVWKQYEKYADGDLVDAIAELGKRDWYE